MGSLSFLGASWNLPARLHLVCKDGCAGVGFRMLFSSVSQVNHSWGSLGVCTPEPPSAPPPSGRPHGCLTRLCTGNALLRSGVAPWDLAVIPAGATRGPLVFQRIIFLLNSRSPASAQGLDGPKTRAHGMIKFRPPGLCARITR